MCSNIRKEKKKENSNNNNNNNINLLKLLFLFREVGVVDLLTCCYGRPLRRISWVLVIYNIRTCDWKFRSMQGLQLFLALFYIKQVIRPDFRQLLHCIAGNQVRKYVVATGFYWFCCQSS